MWKPWGAHSCGFIEAEFQAPGGGQPVAGRLFYPAPAAPSDAQASWLAPWRWFFPRGGGVPWLWHHNYARGLAKFLFFRMNGRVYDAMEKVFAGMVVLLGKSQRLDLHPGAVLAEDLPEQLPLVVFSHGLGGHRFLYSVICSELASQGYLLLALEHGDGSASAALLPGGTWKLYGGLGNEEAQVAKTRVRVKEMKAALGMMQALHRGDRLPGLQLTHGKDPGGFLKGRVDMRCVAAAGHSYGGATTTALIAEDPRFRCGIALDPWWYAVFPESKALHRFETRTPLLIMGSHDWNVPNQFGQLSCGGERQELVLEAARARSEDGARTGGGAMMLCIAGSSHNTFADALPLFAQQSGWMLERLGLTARLDPVLGVHLCTTAMLAFLGLHLPLTPEQRAAQNWEPSKPESKPRWDAILHHDAVDSEQEHKPGMFSWLFPGRGLLLSLSDFAMNRILPRPGAFKAVSAGGPPLQNGASGPNATENGAGPDDVISGAEAAEAALPSANPASGQHPHAPGAPTDTPPLTAGLQPSGSLGAPGGRPGSATGQLSEERQALLRAGANTRYQGGIEEEEVEEMVALLGRRHIFKCYTTASKA